MTIGVFSMNTSNRGLMIEGMICLGPKSQLWLSWFHHDHISLYVSVFTYIFFFCHAFEGRTAQFVACHTSIPQHAALRLPWSRWIKPVCQSGAWLGLVPCWWHYVDEFVYNSLYQRGDPSRGENASGKCWVFFGLTFGVWRRIFEAVWRNDPWVIVFLGCEICCVLGKP